MRSRTGRLRIVRSDEFGRLGPDHWASLEESVRPPVDPGRGLLVMGAVGWRSTHDGVECTWFSVIDDAPVCKMRRCGRPPIESCRALSGRPPHRHASRPRPAKSPSSPPRRRRPAVRLRSNWSWQDG